MLNNVLFSADYAANDVAGNFSVTLIDALDTFVVLNDPPGFEDAVRKVLRWVSFDVNTKPQVFETTIRVLGGLLSGHIYANKTDQPFHLPWYRGELLEWRMTSACAYCRRSPRRRVCPMRGYVYMICTLAMLNKQTTRKLSCLSRCNIKK